MPRQVRVLMESQTGTFKWTKAVVVKPSDDGLLVKVPRYGTSALLRPGDKRRLERAGKEKPFWLLKEGSPVSTAQLVDSVVHGNGQDGTRTSAVLQQVHAKLPEPVALDEEQEVLVEEVDGGLLFRLVSEKAIGDYIAGSMMVPYVQGVIIVGAILAGAAAVLGWLTLSEAAAAKDAAMRVLQAMGRA